MLWPNVSARSRLAALSGAPKRAEWTRFRPNAAFLIVAAGACGFLFADAGGAIALAVLAWTVGRQSRRRRFDLRRRAAARDLAEALELVVGELRSGAHPASAVANVAADSASETGKVLRAIASTARLGGDVRAAIEHFAAADRLRGPVLRQFGEAWSTAENYGVPLAELLEALHRDLSQRIRFESQVDARMAGPRATAAVLAALPIVGLLLGEAMGAAPFAVLARTGFGQGLLVIGAALMCAGLAWSARLITRVVTA
ncbi:type II secretion system F family protein [Allokutzneria sp. A3M-2-11 16]|uniref:type II secretion system F family protein n=1 Tax=Allokutzneria sp. A3M-2-11 16 TaxID=2962043 RepID=UPI0020B6485C|nr:type II secretion system F family protein [Allokutzneria sp. A3M-2-11 16]MCP3799882.1 type II secretion system F family protein [Allokutzneria sp. A3M-2-11 16]